MVVVLPVPLTPTIRMTNGCLSDPISRGFATGARIFSISAARTCRTSSGAISLSSRFWASASVIRAATLTPRSALSSNSSSSSIVARSSFRLVKSSVMPPVSASEDRESPDFSRSHQIFGATEVGDVAGAEGEGVTTDSVGFCSSGWTGGDCSAGSAASGSEAPPNSRSRRLRFEPAIMRLLEECVRSKVLPSVAATFVETISPAVPPSSLTGR